MCLASCTIVEWHVSTFSLSMEWMVGSNPPPASKSNFALSSFFRVSSPLDDAEGGNLSPPHQHTHGSHLSNPPSLHQPQPTLLHITCPSHIPTLLLPAPKETDITLSDFLFLIVNEHPKNLSFYFQRQRRSTIAENCCCWDEVKFLAVLAF